MDDARWDAFSRKRDAIARETERLKSTWVNPRTLPPRLRSRVLGQPIEREYTLHELLRRPNVSYARFRQSRSGADMTVDDPVVAEQVEIQAKYQGYIARQQDEVERREAQESLPLPADLDYARRARPVDRSAPEAVAPAAGNLGQAARISGITPAAISLLLVHLRRASDKSRIRSRRRSA